VQKIYSVLKSKFSELVTDFIRENSGLFFFNEQSLSEEIEKWREDYYISNDAMGLSITLGGGLKGGIIFYIENYGFYEGGTNNEYRIEPDKLVALLTGKMTSRVIKNQILKLEQKIEQCQAQLKEYQQEMETALQKIDVSSDNYLEQKKKVEMYLKAACQEKDMEIQVLTKQKDSWMLRK